MRRAFLVVVLAACEPQLNAPDDFCSGEPKLEIDGARLAAIPFCTGFEYTLDPSGFVDWTRRSISVAIDDSGVPIELRVTESDPMGDSSTSFYRAEFSGYAGSDGVCLEARVGVPGRVAPVIIRMFATIQCGGQE